MNEVILDELKAIEQREKVRILYACESGSRAWGFPSKDSDYDVRFIYIHSIDWYLSISDKRDVIEIPINDVLDINGWDIRKALKLFRKSNPPMLEWLQSPIVYLEQFNAKERIKDLIPEVFSPKSCMYHYLSMAKSNYRDYLKQDQVKVKKYFYALRPVLACMWIEKYQTMPPTEFGKLVDSILADTKLKYEINELLIRKMTGAEMDCQPKIAVINDFLDEQISHFDEYLKGMSKVDYRDETVLNSVFRDALKEVWSLKL